jgi:hypothetical protein
MKIDVAWLKSHDACPEVIARFVEWAGDEPRSLEEIAEHHANSFDLAWLIEKVAPFEYRMAVTCQIAGEAAGIFSRRPGYGYRHWWFARNINPGNIGEALEFALNWRASSEDLIYVYEEASRGRVLETLLTFVSKFDKDVPEHIDTMFREALRSVALPKA